MSDTTNKYRLQLRVHKDLFETYEDAVTYINETFKPEALLAEPAVFFYGPTSSLKMLLAIGATKEATNPRVCIINNNELGFIKDDVAQLTEDVMSTIDASGLTFDENKITERVTYEPDSHDTLIADATSLADAISAISKFAQEKAKTLSTTAENTDSINITYSETENGSKISADVKVSEIGSSDMPLFNNNIVGIKSDGMYSAVHISYNEATHELTLTTSGIDSEGKFKDDAHSTTINLLANTSITAQNTNTVSTTVSENTDGNWVLSANVNLHPDNSIVSDNNGIRTNLTAGNGLRLSSNEFSVRLGEQNEGTFLKATEGGLTLTGVSSIKQNAEANTESINAEVLRAQTQEAVIAGNLSDEVTRAKAKENELQGEIDVINGNALTEGSIAKAVADEAALRQQGDNTLSTNLATETERATTTENTLLSNITAEISRATESELNISSDLSALSDKVDSIVIEQNATNPLQYYLKVAGVTVGTINIPKDQFLKQVTYNSDTKVLRFVFITKEDENTIVEINMSDLVDTYTAGNGLNLAATGEFSIKLSEDTEDYITVTRNGVAIKGIDAIRSNVLSNTEDIQNEISRANLVESGLNTRLTSTENSITVINGNASTEGSIAKAVADEAAVRSLADSTLQTAINKINGNASTEGSIAKAVADEAALRSLGDSTLQTAINKINGNASTTGSIANAVAEEATLRASGDSALQTAIDKINGNASTEGSFAKAVADEAALRSLGDSALQTAIDKINGNAATEGSFAKAVADEAALRSLGDSALQTAIETEKNRSIQADSEISTRVTATENSIGSITIEKESDLDYNLLINGVVKGHIEIPEDLYLQNVEYDDNTKRLHFVYTTPDGIQDKYISLTSLVSTYTAGSGLSLNNNAFSIKLNNDLETSEYLTVTSDGLKLSGVNSALANKANTADVYTKTQSDAKYLTQTSIDGLATENELNEAEVRLTLNGSETETVTVTAIKTVSGTNVSADLNIDSEHDGNILRTSSNGVYVKAKLSFNTATNVLTFDDGGSSATTIDLSSIATGATLITGGYYDYDKKEIVLTYTLHGEPGTIKIPISDLLDTNSVLNKLVFESSDTIAFTKEVDSATGIRTYTANLTVDATDIPATYDTLVNPSVQDVINDMSDNITKLKGDIYNNTNTVEITKGSDPVTGVRTIKADAKISSSDHNAIIADASGLFVSNLANAINVNYSSQSTDMQSAANNIDSRLTSLETLTHGVNISDLAYSSTLEDGKIYSSLSQTEGKISAQQSSVINVKLSGYTNSQSVKGDIYPSDTIAIALNKLENAEVKLASTSTGPLKVNNEGELYFDELDCGEYD